MHSALAELAEASDALKQWIACTTGLRGTHQQAMGVATVNVNSVSSLQNMLHVHGEDCNQGGGCVA